MKWQLQITCVVAFSVLSISAQGIRSVAGTAISVNVDARQVVVQPDRGESQIAKISDDTVLQRVAPNERDLRKAERIQLRDIAPGDRVLVTLETGVSEARRIILMSEKDISSRNQEDTKDWAERGIAGVVSAKKDGEIIVNVRTAGGQRDISVTLNDRTSFKRYAPDSVRFIDAKPAKPEDIQPGDQLRARGQKNEDGSKLTAQDMVFGTFLTKTGSVTAVDPATNEVHITETATGKPLVVRLMAGTQIKATPDFGGGGMPPGGPGGRGPGGPNQAGGFGPPAGGPPGAGAAPPDPVQIIERMPLANIDAVKPGQTVIVSSTKGARPDEVTAIVLVANAQALLQMVSRQTTGGRGGRGGPDDNGLSPGVMGMGGLGFDMSGIMPQ